MEFHPGDVLLLGQPVQGAEPGIYVLLSLEDRRASLCRAGEEPNPGDVCLTDRVVTVRLEDLERFRAAGVRLDIEGT